MKERKGKGNSEQRKHCKKETGEKETGDKGQGGKKKWRTKKAR